MLETLSHLWLSFHMHSSVHWGGLRHICPFFSYPYRCCFTSGLQHLGPGFPQWQLKAFPFFQPLAFSVLHTTSRFLFLPSDWITLFLKYLFWILIAYRTALKILSTAFSSACSELNMLLPPFVFTNSVLLTLGPAILSQKQTNKKYTLASIYVPCIDTCWHLSLETMLSLSEYHYLKQYG